MTVFFIRPAGSNPMAYWFIHLANNYRANDDEEDPPEIRQQLFPYAVAFQLFRYDANRDIAVTGQHDLLLDEHYFDDATNDRIRGELFGALAQTGLRGRTATFLGLMSGLTNYTMADELRVKQASDIAVATGDLLAVDRTAKQGVEKAQASSRQIS